MHQILTTLDSAGICFRAVRGVLPLILPGVLNTSAKFLGRCQLWETRSTVRPRLTFGPLRKSRSYAHSTNPSRVERDIQPLPSLVPLNRPCFPSLLRSMVPSRRAFAPSRLPRPWWGQCAVCFICFTCATFSEYVEMSKSSHDRRVLKKHEHEYCGLWVAQEWRWGRESKQTSQQGKARTWLFFRLHQAGLDWFELLVRAFKNQFILILHLLGSRYILQYLLWQEKFIGLCACWQSLSLGNAKHNVPHQDPSSLYVVRSPSRGYWEDFESCIFNPRSARIGTQSPVNAIILKIWVSMRTKYNYCTRKTWSWKVLETPISKLSLFETIQNPSKSIYLRWRFVSWSRILLLMLLKRQSTGLWGHLSGL